MLDFLKGGNFRKFTVIKNDDIRDYLSYDEKNALLDILSKINAGRREAGKNSSNLYLVINVYESYASEIVEILKRNGHWG